MKLQVVDNFLDLDLIETLKDTFLYNTPHHYGQSSNPNSPNKFYISFLEQEFE